VDCSILKSGVINLIIVDACSRNDAARISLPASYTAAIASSSTTATEPMSS
jgi:hypothetical protein